MAFHIQNNYGDNYEVHAGATIVAGGIEVALARKEAIDKIKREAEETGVSFSELMKKYKDNVVDAEVVDTVTPDEILSPANLFTHQQGILEDGDMWILLVAAKARKKAFKHLPDFVDWAFDTFQVPFDKERCKSKLQSHMRNQGWDTIKNQDTMISFIKSFRQRVAERTNDTHKANAIYVAIRDIII